MLLNQSMTVTLLHVDLCQIHKSPDQTNKLKTMGCDRLIYVLNGGHRPAPFGNSDFIKINQKFKNIEK